MKFRRALAWAASGHLSRSLIRFFSSIAIARLLLPEEVGIFALAMSAGVMLGILREIGGGAFLVQKEGLQTHHIQSAYGVMIIIAIIAAGLCLLSKSWIAVVYNWKRRCCRPRAAVQGDRTTLDLSHQRARGCIWSFRVASPLSHRVRGGGHSECESHKWLFDRVI